MTPVIGMELIVIQVTMVLWRWYEVMILLSCSQGRVMVFTPQSDSSTSLYTDSSAIDHESEV
jgi:hypothetical protein